MQTREILSIVALAALGLCLLCGLAKMAMKNPKAKQACNKACSLLVFVGLTLIGVSQLLGETKNTSPQVPAHLIPPAGTLGGACIQLSDNRTMCGTGLKCSSDGKCMLPIPDPSGHHHHTSGPTPQKTLFPIPTSGPKPAPGTAGGACLRPLASQSKPFCLGSGDCVDGKCIPAGHHHHTSGPTPQKTLFPIKQPGTLGGPCIQLTDDKSFCRPPLMCNNFGVCDNSA